MVISPSPGVAVSVGVRVVVGVGVMDGERGGLVGSRVGSGEQAGESTDEMPRVDKSLRNPLRLSMAYPSFWVLASILCPVSVPGIDSLYSEHTSVSRYPETAVVCWCSHPGGRPICSNVSRGQRAQ
jgi:hypothetical protein